MLLCDLNRMAFLLYDLPPRRRLAVARRQVTLFLNKKKKNKHLIESLQKMRRVDLLNWIRFNYPQVRMTRNSKEQIILAISKLPTHPPIPPREADEDENLARQLRQQQRLLNEMERRRREEEEEDEIQQQQQQQQDEEIERQRRQEEEEEEEMRRRMEEDIRIRLEEEEQFRNLFIREINRH